MYVDFVFKQIIEYFVRNLLIYTALFFGEKYIIEYITKKTIDSFVFNSNKLFSLSDLSFHDFFLYTTSVVFYAISASLLFCLFL